MAAASLIEWCLERSLELAVEDRVHLDGRHRLGGLADQHHDLALRRSFRGECRGQFGQGATADGLEHLGQFARHHGLPIAQNRRRVRQHFGQAVRALEQHQRAGNSADLGQPRAPRGALGRQKPFEEEAVRRQARDHERGQDRRTGPGIGVTGRPSSIAAWTSL